MGKYQAHKRLCVDVMSVQKQVTGSCMPIIVHLPDGGKVRFILDCGIFQEPDYLEENKVLPFNPENFEFAVLTHNHADHFGRLPYLVKKGFEGQIHCTKGTSILLPPALRDTLKIEKDRAKRTNSKALYSEREVDKTLVQITPHNFKERFKVSQYINLTFFKNGHLPGAAIVLVEIWYPGYESINLLFTGDYKDTNDFFDVPDLPERVLELPITVVQECTYGTTITSIPKESQFEKNLIEVLSNKGTALTLALSQGRTQEVLLRIKQMQEQGKLDVNIPIYSDGSLSRTYTNMWLNADIGVRECMRDFIPRNFNFVDNGIRRSIMQSNGPKVIVTSSGMGSHGPAQEYLPYFLDKKNALIQFTSYLAEGTAGRQLKDSDPELPVKLFGRIFPARQANIQFSTEFSSHAKQDKLLQFLQKFKNLQTVILNHGSYECQYVYGKLLLSELPNTNICVLGEYLFRIDSEKGLTKTIPTKF